MRFNRMLLWVLTPAIAVMSLFIIGLILLGWHSLHTTVGLGIDNYAAFAQRADYIGALWRTLWLSFITTLICIVIGYPVAQCLARAQRWRGVLTILVILPWMVSVVVRTYGWVVLLGNRGTLNSFLRWIGATDAPVQFLFNATGNVIGLTHVLCPFMILSLLAVMSHLDRSLEEASMGLGAGPVETFLRVTLPLTVPGLVTGCSVVFLLAAGSVVTPLLLGGPRIPMLATQIFRAVFELFNFPRAASMAFILMALAIVVVSPLYWLDKIGRTASQDTAT
jgi:putative spermidine/putrescine transport system permease protein